MARLLEAFLVLLAKAVMGKEYEWAGIFATPEDHYMWTAQKVDGGYVDPAMKLVALPASDLTESGLDTLEPDGNSVMAGNCIDLSAGGTITPSATTCYRLTFNQDLWQSLYYVDTSAVSGIAFFAEHFPTEFENTAHYFKDSVGEDIEPQAELPKAEDHEEEETIPAGAAIGASVLVNMVTFVGVVLMIPALAKAAKENQLFFHGVLFAFAAGALLSCAFFLLLFESTHLVAVGWTAEVDVLWRWGTMILAGLIVPALIETLATFALQAQGKQMVEEPGETAVVSVEGAQPQDAASVEGAQPQDAAEVQKVDFRARARLTGAVVVGDFFHNLCDGFFLGAAFKGCGESFGWGVAAATLLHELPQELADFAVLTGPEVALSHKVALMVNFVSGLSVLLGTIVILWSDVGDDAVGLLLAFGGGVYIHVGAVDCMPKMYNPNFSLRQRLACFSSFIIGAVAIGLILIGHEHCVPGAADGEGGHAHGH